VVDPGAKLADDVTVGPLAVVGGEVELGPGVEIGPQVVVTGRTRVGARTRVFPFSVVGVPPQTLGFDGNAGELVIGSDNVIREHASLHAGLPEFGGLTAIGDHNLIMNGVHVAHDCRVANHCVLSAQSVLGGHVVIEDHAVLGGMTAVHQFARIGDSAFLTGCSAVPGDVIPFGVARGNLAKLRGLNIIGMRRSGMPRAEIQAARQAYRVLFDRSRPMAENVAAAATEFANSPSALKIIDFLGTREKRYFVTPALDDDGDEDDATND
jgi:UDP-N-acetylglucosamine acyltransferase